MPGSVKKSSGRPNTPADAVKIIADKYTHSSLKRILYNLYNVGTLKLVNIK